MSTRPEKPSKKPHKVPFSRDQPRQKPSAPFRHRESDTQSLIDDILVNRQALDELRKHPPPPALPPLGAGTRDAHTSPPQAGVDHAGGGGEVTRVPRHRSKTRTPSPIDVTVSSSVHLVKRSPSESSLAQRRPHRLSEGDSESALVASMAARLTKLEKEHKQTKLDLKKKDFMVSELKKMNQDLRAALKNEDAAKEIAQLRRENDYLEKQVIEMEDFLQEYGMQWVGDRSEKPSDTVVEYTPGDGGKGGGAEQNGEGEGSGRTSVTFRYNYTKLALSVRELNMIAGSESKSFAADPKSGGVNKLQAPEALPLAVYRNGFMLKAGPFRPFTEADAQAFIRDLEDGYFPYELKHAYPDGVPFSLTDHTGEDYGDPNGAGGLGYFPGSGRALGGNKKPSRLLGKGRGGHGHGHAASIHNLDSANDPSIAPPDTNAFLNRLPNAVVRNGNIVNVREEITNMVQGKAGSRGDGSGDTGAGPQTREVRHNSADDSSTSQATIMVRSPDGEINLVVRLGYESTIGDLRHCVEREGYGDVLFELRTAFPPQVFSDDTQSLRDAALIPRAKLLMRVIGEKQGATSAAGPSTGASTDGHSTVVAGARVTSGDSGDTGAVWTDPSSIDPSDILGPM